MRLLQLKYWKWVVFINFMSLCKANMALGKFVAKNWTRMGKKRDIQYSNFSPLLISKAQEKEKIGVDLWCIWQSWNTKLWEEKDTSPVVAFSLAMQTLHQWQQLNSVHQTHQPSTSKNPKEDELSSSLSVPLQVIKRTASAHPLSETSALSQNPLMRAKRSRSALSARARTRPPI